MNSTILYLLIVSLIFSVSHGQACGTVGYIHDESKNALGANKCSQNCDCDGQRTCSPWGWCQGTSRPAIACGTTAYIHDESKNGLGANKCSQNCDCDGQRTCSQWGWCQGTARPTIPTTPTIVCGTPEYIHDESKNALGANKCSQNCDCDGQRTCSQWGWCQGTARTTTTPTTPTIACGTPEYIHDESKNVLGANKCSQNCDCDGQRTCSQWGWCQGTSRTTTTPTVPACGTPGYIHDESKNVLGANKCSKNCDCDGQRTCSPWGWCQGTSRTI